MDQSGDRVAKLDLVVGDTVAAQNRAAGLVNLLRAAFHDFREHVQVALRGPRQDGKRRNRPSAHGVNIAQGVSGGDGSKSMRIVDHRAEKIHRLHQRGFRA